jgi:hypothetical protein
MFRKSTLLGIAENKSQINTTHNYGRYTAHPYD